MAYELTVIGHVSSPLRDTADAPRQGDEGAPPARLVFEREFAGGLEGLSVGDEMLVLTWLHLADRTLLKVFPRGDRSRAFQGVFATRAPHRPNPIGIHRVAVTAVEGTTVVVVSGMEAVDGTPIIDLKPILNDSPGAR
jgi:tRNA-Thr(GGU) m(6)t(6)A37 methyltransferase TsaA